MLRHPGWCINDGEVPCAAKSTGSRRIDSAVASLYQVIPDRLDGIRTEAFVFLSGRVCLTRTGIHFARKRFFYLDAFA
jgi:hypothetical protein